MYLLTIHTKFAAAHKLINYEGPCENLHGHNWKVEVVVSARQLDKAGMGIDFKVLKRETKKTLELLDHKYLNEVPPFNNISPSSENIAQFLFKELGAVFNDDNVKVERINVWETDNACASYIED
jgi:6-pyruvoyltetrahydropterin/6-carboxytetrahydropterin synthase